MFWVSNERHIFFVAVVLYGLSLLYSVFLWRSGFRRQNRVNYLLYLGGFIFHTWAMIKRGSSFARCPVDNLYEATVFVDWTIVATYLALGLWTRLRFVGAFASPIVFSVGVFALMPALDQPASADPNFIHPLVSIHAALILLAYGAFGLGSVAALMYLTQERDLKFRKFRAFFSLLPPIQRLELVASRSLLAGFILLTIGLALGGYYFHSLKQERSPLSDPKVLWSGFVWFLYLGLLLRRWFFFEGGRRFALGAVYSFLFVLLTFWGVNLFSTIHHALK